MSSTDLWSPQRNVRSSRAILVRCADEETELHVELFTVGEHCVVLIKILFQLLRSYEQIELLATGNRLITLPVPLFCMHVCSSFAMQMYALS